MPSFDLEIAYTQIAVFDVTLTNPFNDWTDSHVAQGFSWRPGSVSFGTLENGGQACIDVFLSQFLNKNSEAERIIAVPFTVPCHGAIAIASIVSSVTLELPSGVYELTFEHGRNTKNIMWVKFYFQSMEVPSIPRILKADAELHPMKDLIMTANPA
jgi:hypothetical protein